MNREHPADGGHGPGLSAGRGVTPDRQAVVNREHPADGGARSGSVGRQRCYTGPSGCGEHPADGGHGPGLSVGGGVTPDRQAVVNTRRTEGTVRVSV